MLVVPAGCWLVALRKESVDRNARQKKIGRLLVASLSARRAWIEILILARQVCSTCVALRKESVDRNNVRHTAAALPSVALRKESVDRNKQAPAF